MATEFTITADELAPGTCWLIDLGPISCGTVTDEQTTLNRGRYAAWSMKAGRADGIVGWYHTRDEAINAIKALYTPQRRTLKNIKAPFWIVVDNASATHPIVASQPVGELLQVVSLDMANVRTGRTADGRKVLLWGAATKHWIIPGATA